MNAESRGRMPRLGLAIALLAGSMLMYEVLLTRICSLRLYYHFGFLVVSNCLLGVGASAAVIAVLQDRLKEQAHAWIWRATAGYFLVLPLVYAGMLAFPIPAELRLTEVRDMGVFTAFNFLAALPFFFSGGAIGLILTFESKNVNRLYALDLLGAGLGCVVLPFALREFGAGGSITVVWLLALGAAVTLAPSGSRRAVQVGGACVALAGLVLVPSLDQMFPVPGKSFLALTEEVSVDTAGAERYSRWSTNSRVDVVETDFRGLFLAGAKRMHWKTPPQKLILQDGWAGTFVYDFSNHPENLNVLRDSMYSSALRLKDSPRVFIIGTGGGPDLWAAKLRNPEQVLAVELNQSIIDVHTELVPGYSRGLLEDPAIGMVQGEGRAMLMASDRDWDVIQLSGIDTFTALRSGAYVMAENYLYTLEAMDTMIEHLAPGGILQIVRLAADAESLRLVTTIVEAMDRKGIEGVENALIVLRTPTLSAASMVKPDGFTADEARSTVDFAQRIGLDVVYAPGYRTGTLIEEFMTSADRARFIDEFAYDVTPTTDDQPYFFNFFKWSRVFVDDATSDPSSLVGGSPSFILTQLAISSTAATILILVPVIVFARRSERSPAFGRFLAYFSALGVGFIFIEVALMQQLTLYLEEPLYSITVTLFSILIFSGIGSMVSARWFETAGAPVMRLPIAIGAGAVVVGLLAQWMTASFSSLPISVKIVSAVLMLAPLSICLGVPFAYGVRLLDRIGQSELIPWAWGVNGLLTVVGSVLTAFVSMNIGFFGVLVVAAAVYLLGFLAIRRYA